MFFVTTSVPPKKILYHRLRVKDKKKYVILDYLKNKFRSVKVNVN